MELAKEPKDTLVVVAMSGGVDSSTVAAMMKNEGYKVIGITLNFITIQKKQLNLNNVVQVKILWMQKELLIN